jgi:hypothetical protein
MAVGPAPAHASFTCLFQVAQPIFTDAGVTIVEVPFLSNYIDWRDPAAELLLTAEPNAIRDDNGPAQRNEATGEGIRFVNTAPNARFDEREWPHLRADTLEVLVDLRGLKPLPTDERIRESHRSTQQDILTATLWCGLKNARAHWPTVRYVRYTFKGSNLYLRFAGVYSLEQVQAPCQHVEWDGKFLEAAHR